MQAYKQLPEGLDPQDVLQINTKNMTLDIDPFIREAIFISLPYSFVSQKKDSSKSSNSSPSDSQSFKPFANLKDLL